MSAVERRQAKNTTRSQERAKHEAPLDTLPAERVAAALLRPETLAPRAVLRQAPVIAKAASLVADALVRGGRLVYVGAGTAGRVAALDAIECVTTFTIPPSRLVWVMAGGPRALMHATPVEEDPGEAEARLRSVAPGPRDVLCLLAAPPTPFARAALAIAKKRRSRTILISTEKRPAAEADIVLSVAPAAGALPGDPWLGVGTALKILLSALSRTAMVLIGKTYGETILEVAPSLPRSRERAVEIVRVFTGLDDKAAGALLDRSGGRPRVALVMHHKKVSRARAEELIVKNRGKIRPIVGEMRRE